MTTSRTAAFNPDILDLIEEAYEAVGMELRGGYDLKTARRSLDMLMREWGNRGINLWTVTSGVTTFNEGVGINPIVTPYSTMIDLLDVSWRTGTGVNLNDRSMQRLTLSQSAQISSKLERGTPTQFYVERTATVPNLLVYPVPDGPGTAVWWGLRTIQDAGTYTNTMDVPPRFLPALVYGLAYHIAMKTPNAAERIPMLQTEYERQWELAAEEDRDRGSFFMIPDMSSYNR